MLFSGWLAGQKWHHLGEVNSTGVPPNKKVNTPATDTVAVLALAILGNDDRVDTTSAALSKTDQVCMQGDQARQLG
jgi:hypothetical protein